MLGVQQGEQKLLLRRHLSFRHLHLNRRYHLQLLVVCCLNTLTGKERKKEEESVAKEEKKKEKGVEEARSFINRTQRFELV